MTIYQHLRPELDNLLEGIAPALLSVAHIKLVTGMFGAHTSMTLIQKASNLLSPVAAICPALRQMHNDENTCLDELLAFKARCHNLELFVESVASLPAGTSAQLYQLLQLLIMHTVMFVRGD